jgi:hypothetical protein
MKDACSLVCSFVRSVSRSCGRMGTGTPITCRDCCAIKLRERAYTPASRSALTLSPQSSRWACDRQRKTKRAALRVGSPEGLLEKLDSVFLPPLPLSLGPWPLSSALCSSNDLCGEQRLHKTVRRIHGPVFQRIDVASDIRMIVEPSAHVLVKPE